MAYSHGALAGFAALVLTALPCAAGLEPVSLLQTRLSFQDAREDVASPEQASAGSASRSSKASWPNPADPNMQASSQQKSAIENLKAQPHNMQLVNATISSIALTPVWYVVQQDGYDILFRALHDFANEPTVQMNAWRGLSDQSHTEVGSQYIANYGGPNKGIEYMVEQLKAHPTAYDAECADHLTYQYEVLQCISGLLKWDVNGTRGAAAARAGLLEATVHTLDVEHDRRPSIDTACNTLAFLLDHDPSYAVQLRELGAEKLVQAALARYSKYDPTPFYFGATYGSSYPVIFGCGRVLAHLSRLG